MARFFAKLPDHNNKLAHKIEKHKNQKYKKFQKILRKMSKLRCFNPFCSRKRDYFKNQKGLELHLLNNKSCLFHLINDSNNTNIVKYNNY